MRGSKRLDRKSFLVEGRGEDNKTIAWGLYERGSLSNHNIRKNTNGEVNETH